MEIVFSEYVQVTDSSSVGEVRRSALLAAQRLGFDETRSGEFALLATEASRNVLVHGGGGQVLVVAMREDQGPLGSILAMDKGPGIPDLPRAMSDGYSTGGTMGGGLGAMKRMASLLEIYSNRDGTLALIQIGKDSSDEQPLHIAGVVAPYPGERVCGDAWNYHQTPERLLILVVDGLGHGFGAAEAAAEAVVTFRKRLNLAPGQILEYVHESLRKTRGAVAAVAEIRPQQRRLVYAGIGNISAVVVNGTATRSLVSHSGTLGLVMSRVQEFTLDFPAGSVLVMHSDGIQNRWDLSTYPGLLGRHPALIAGALLRDFRRQRDDASVVVVKSV